MRSIYISLPADAADRLRELAWRERRSPRQQAAVLVLAALERDAETAARRENQSPRRRSRKTEAEA
jgi:hypothetical protein